MQVVSAGDRIIREREQGRNAGSLTAPAVGDRASDLAGIPGVLRLLPEPVPVDVKTANDRPIEFRDAVKTRNVVAAEGPERLSGDWWKDPYHREYFRICTADGELLWLYREIRRTGDLRWWLHGWWD
jgi:protein ImuB